MHALGEAQPKRVYRSPALVVYGDLLQITQTFGKSGLSDGGSGVNKKTSP